MASTPVLAGATEALLCSEEFFRVIVRGVFEVLSMILVAEFEVSVAIVLASDVSGFPSISKS